MGRKIKRAVMFAATFFPSFLRIALLRLLGHHIGKNIRISILTVLVADEIVIEDGAIVGPLNIVLSGGRVVLRRASEVSFLVIISGRGDFHLGERSYVSLKTFIDLEGGVQIGSYCGTGPGTMIFSHAIFLPPTKGYPHVVGKTSLGDFVWLGGMNFVTAGTAIGDNTMTAPMVTVSKNIGPDVFWISDRRSIPMERYRRKIGTEKCAEFVLRSIVDFCRTEGLDFDQREDAIRIENRLLRLVTAPQSVSDGEIVLICGSEAAELRESARQWYDFQSLDCSPNLNDNFHRRLRRFWIKYYGTHFLDNLAK